MIDRFRPLRSLIIALALALGLLPGATLLAQDATPESGGSLLSQLGLPVIEITVGSQESILPTEATAGLNLLTVHNDTEGFVVSSISQLPEGVTSDDYLAALVSGELPDWVFDAVIVGGLDQDPGTTSSIVIDLAPGTWTIGLQSEDVPVVNPIGELVVTGEADPNAGDAISADVTAGLGAYVFDLPDTVSAGPQIWRVDNTHAAVHHLVLFEADRLYSEEEIIGGLEALFMGTPVADGFDLSAAGVPFATSALSEGESIWIEVDLQPGYYVALCFLPDAGGGPPHAFMGMVDSFEVTAS